MNGMVQAALLFYCRGRLRSLLVSAALLLLAVHAGTRDPGCCRSLGLSGIAHFVTWNGFTALGILLVVAAFMFRTASASPMLRLVPGAKLRLLSGLLAPLPLLAAVGTAAVVLGGDATMLPRGGGLVYLDITAVELLVILLAYAIMASGRAMLMFFAVLMLVCAFPEKLPAFFRAALLFSPLALAAGAGFAAWYLRASAIRPPLSAEGQNARLENLFLWSFGRLSVVGARDPAELAFRHHVLGEPTILRAALRTAGPSIACYAGLLVFYMLMLLRHSRLSMFQSAALVAVMVLAISEYATVREMVARSRISWIHGGLSREAIFMSCEGLAWSGFAVIAPVITGLSAIEWFALPHPPHTWAKAFILPMATYLVAMYLALMNIGRARLAINVAAFIALSLALELPMFAPLGFPRWAAPLDWGVPAGLIVSAVALRCIAARRWRHVDWLTLHPAGTTGYLAAGGRRG